MGASGVALDEVGEFALAADADDSLDGLAVAEQHHRRHAPDAVLLCEPLVVVDVHLRDRRRGGPGNALDDWRQLATGRTPVGVEVRQDDAVTGQFREVVLALDVDRLVRRPRPFVVGPSLVQQLLALLFSNLVDRV